MKLRRLFLGCVNKLPKIGYHVIFTTSFSEEHGDHKHDKPFHLGSACLSSFLYKTNSLDTSKISE